MSESDGVRVAVFIAVALVLAAGSVVVGIAVLGNRGPDYSAGTSLLHINGAIDVDDDTLLAHHQVWVTDADDVLLMQLFARAAPRVLSISKSPRLRSLRSLEGAASLEALAISQTPHLDWRTCPDMPGLRDLTVGHDTPFTDETVGLLVRFPSLRVLEIWNAQELTDKGVALMAQQHGLDELALYNAESVSLGAIAELSRSELSVLRLGLRIGYDFDVTEWGPLSNLTRLDLRRCTEISRDQMGQLRILLPRTRISESEE